MNAPTHWRGIFKHLGPGLIVTACIVGSGELIATPKVGADHAFSLLWFIILGCVIKVFVQVELGRAAVAHGKTTLQLMNEIPGPRLIVSWLVWCWLFMYIGVFFQLSGIVGGVSQVFAEMNLIPSAGGGFMTPDKYLAIGVSVITALILASGRYKVVERFSVIMVVFFTFTTVIALYTLQTAPEMEAYRITSANIMEGLQFRLPDDFDTAFAAFGIIGVGATELIYYPYWCLEKGYSKNVGPMEDVPSSQYDCPRCGARKSFLGTIYTSGIAWMRKASLAPKCSECGNILGNAELRPDSWYLRAQGWLKVMRIDAWISMVIYTSATIAFFLLGAALLYSPKIAAEKVQAIIDERVPSLEQKVRQLGSVKAEESFEVTTNALRVALIFPDDLSDKGKKHHIKINLTNAAARLKEISNDKMLKSDKSEAAKKFKEDLMLVVEEMENASEGVNDKTMISDLSKMYRPLGKGGLVFFLIGAFVVLFSTLVSATASNARLLANGLVLYRLKTVESDGAQLRLVRSCSIVIPLLCCLLFIIVGKPMSMVLIGGVAQALMLPFLAGAALYYRYRKIDAPLQPGNTWTVFLWIAALAMAAVGIYQLITKLAG
jgi:Mn2+/Fe2+ NRAMP family transporter